MIAVPEAVRRKAENLGLESWLEDTEGLVSSLEHDWGLRSGRVFDDATEALVLEAELEDGTQAVLKLLVPRSSDAAGDEIRVLSNAGGDGCAHLLRSDLARNALLLERLGPSMYQLQLPMDLRHHHLVQAVSRVWRHPPDPTLRSGSLKAELLIKGIQEMWEQLDRPCSEAAVDHAIRSATNRREAFSEYRARLVHGDVHQWNALQFETGFKLIDPDGLFAEPEYDLGIIMREDPVELLQGDPMDRAQRLAASTGLDPTAIWEWGVVERVSTGLILTGIELQPAARQMLKAADSVVDIG